MRWDKIVNIDKKILEEKLNEIKSDPSLRRARIFVENFFNTLHEESLESAYLNYLRDISRYTPTNKAIRNNSTYLCYIFSKITHSSIEELSKIESKYRHISISPLDPDSLDKMLWGEIIGVCW